MNTIAERFLLLRGKNKQGDFAKALGINPNTLRNYESGRVLPNQEVLERICVQFSVSPEWLLLGRGSMPAGEGAELPPPPHAGELCARCTKLEAELEAERRERRELTSENRHLWRENGELREKCARLEERQYQRSLNHDGGEAVG